MKHTHIIVVFSIVLLASCVPQKKFTDLESRYNRDTEFLKSRNENLQADFAKLSDKYSSLENMLKSLNADKANLDREIIKSQTKFDNLNKLYKELEKDKMSTESESATLLQDLQILQNELLEKEDQLSKKEQRLNELQSVLDRQSQAVNDLRNIVRDALFGFEDNGLSISKKNGKVYVSLDESLLFKSGSYSVGERGIDALKKLAVVLEKNTSINVLIEGHTDDVPYKGKGQLKDNWDLSVKRATAIVKIITENSSVEPKRLMAAGRSKYLPVDTNDSPEARQKNRRTEIILTPKLDELFEILGNN